MKILLLVGLLLTLNSLSDCLLLASSTYTLFSLGEIGPGVGHEQVPFLLAVLMLGLNLVLAASYIVLFFGGRNKLIWCAPCHFFVYLGLLAVVVLAPESGKQSQQYFDPKWVPDGTFIVQLLSSLYTHVLIALLSSALLVLIWTTSRESNEANGTD